MDIYVSTTLYLATPEDSKHRYFNAREYPAIWVLYADWSSFFEAHYIYPRI
jgi:hypothetical protein